MSGGMGESIGEVRDEAPGKTSDGGVCEGHLKEHLWECNGRDGSGRMHLGRMEKTIEGRGIRRLGRNIAVGTHLEKRRHLKDNHFGETIWRNIWEDFEEDSRGFRNGPRLVVERYWRKLRFWF